MNDVVVSTHVTTNARKGAVILLAETPDSGIARVTDYIVIPLSELPGLIEQLQELMTVQGQAQCSRAAAH